MSYATTSLRCMFFALSGVMALATWVDVCNGHPVLAVFAVANAIGFALIGRAIR